MSILAAPVATNAGGDRSAHGRRLYKRYLDLPVFLDVGQIPTAVLTIPTG